MKKVIDVNFLQDPALAHYLRSDKSNFVVFPDCACMEMYKGNAIKNISKSLEIVSQFPDQVIILKGTRDIVNLSLLPDGFQRFEDPIHTLGFRKFCLDVRSAVNGNFMLSTDIQQKGLIASKQSDIYLNDTYYLEKGIEMLAKSFKHEHISALRKRKKPEAEFFDRIEKDIFLMAGVLFLKHPDIKEIPHISHFPNSYIFRYALSSYLLVLKWISDGGAGNVKREKLSNDFVDMCYVAYATFYDGLLTRDIKMESIFEDTRLVLNNVFCCHDGAFSNNKK